MQAALHQHFALRRMDELDGLCRRGVAVRHVDDLEAVDVEARGARSGGNLAGRPDVQVMQEV